MARQALSKGLLLGEVGTGSTEFIVFGSRQSRTLARYVYYMAKNPAFRSFAISQMRGTSGRQRVPARALEEFEVALPPLSVQRKITCILSSVDEAIEKTRSVIDQLQVVKRGLMQRLFRKARDSTGRDSGHRGESGYGTSQGWTAKTLSQLATYHNGYPFKPIDWTDEGLPIVRIAQLTDPEAKPNYFGGCDIDERHLIDTGDLLFSWSATLKVLKWVQGPAVLNQHIFKVVEVEGVCRDVLSYLLEYSLARVGRTFPWQHHETHSEGRSSQLHRLRAAPYRTARDRGQYSARSTR